MCISAVRNRIFKKVILTKFSGLDTRILRKYHSSPMASSSSILELNETEKELSDIFLNVSKKIGQMDRKEPEVRFAGGWVRDKVSQSFPVFGIYKFLVLIKLLVIKNRKSRYRCSY